MHVPNIVIRQPGRTALHLALHEPLEVGRDCDGLLIGDPEVSRRHVVLTPDGGDVTITDLGSTNGTAVDGERLRAPHTLRSGEIARFGDTTVELVGDRTSGPLANATVANLGAELRSTSIDLVAAAVADEQPAMAADDGGTVTIVFSDIENSTSRAVELGDVAWMEVLKMHNSIVRRQVARHRGTEVKSQGDGFMLAFPSARAALDAMVETQRALDVWARSQPTNAVRVRVGMHTGEVIRHDDDLYGKHVMVAARVANAAKGSEILVSSLVREIVDARGDLSFGHPREVELKGLAGSWTVYPVLWRSGST